MRTTFGFAVGLALAASSASAELRAADVAGKSFEGGGSVFTYGADGALTGTMRNGDRLEGTWSVQNGALCRTIAKPARVAGSACQAATLRNGTLTVTRDDGTQVVLTLR